jgi:NADH-quinone oxidoreductase subunit G/NADP-reducing hydrogenase subunit HndD
MKTVHALNDRNKVVVAQIAPAYYVSVAEAFGQDVGDISVGKLVNGLKEIGFHSVFDLRYAADLTIMEETNELLERIEHGGVLPMITSCCPAWINKAEKQFPSLLPHISSCKSPMSMSSALIKNYWAEQMDMNTTNVVVVSFMPCTVKKQEAERPQLNNDTDVVVTTKETPSLFESQGFDAGDWDRVDDDGEFHPLLGGGTGAGQIFGSTGGVMEAALRSVYRNVTHQKLPQSVADEVRSMNEIKKVSVDLNGTTVNVGVFTGAAAMNSLCKGDIEDLKDLHFIEIMNCPGGCMNGPGQPNIPKEELCKRLKDINEKDNRLEIKESHENPKIKELYGEFLDTPGSHVAHELLHTEYHDKSKKK